jgi:hypothetical protein
MPESHVMTSDTCIPVRDPGNAPTATAALSATTAPVAGGWANISARVRDAGESPTSISALNRSPRHGVSRIIASARAYACTVVDLPNASPPNHLTHATNLQNDVFFHHGARDATLPGTPLLMMRPCLSPYLPYTVYSMQFTSKDISYATPRYDRAAATCLPQ